MRGATRHGPVHLDRCSISIHAPRAGSDAEGIHPSEACEISIHAPRAGSDLSVPQALECMERFQSMLPVRGATHGHSHRQGLIHISIHAPRAGSDSGIVTEMRLILDFNPCSPCGERQTWAAHRPRHKDFNPCSPCGERPAKAKKLFESGMKISIHAPRAGSDRICL